MIEFLLKLLGVQIESAMKVSGVSFGLRNGSLFGWLLLIGLAASVFAWWSYRRAAARLPAGRRRMLTALRILLYVLFLLLLMRPICSFTVGGSIRRMVVMLVDGSASMRIADPRLDEADVKRAQIGKNILKPAKGLGQALDQARAAEAKQIPRVDLLKAVLQNPELKLLPALGEDYDVSLLSFGQEVTEIPRGAPEKTGEEKKPGAADSAWVPNLTATSPQTAIGDAVRDVLNRKRGQPVAGIFLATDGGNNTGSDVNDAASMARQDGVPLFIYGVGITSPRDIIVSDLFAPDVAFTEDEVPVTVRVRGQGLKGQKAQLVLKLGDDVVATHDLDFTEEEEQVVPLKFTPHKTGEFKLTASVAPRADETVKDNNIASVRMHVIDDKIKALIVEQSPRWEYRYVENNLLRDRRVALKILLIEADPAIVGPDTPYLAQFPANKEDLFKLDMLIIGDVDPRVFTPEQMAAVGEFVSKFGGACIFMAGRKFNPDAYRKTPFEKMLPVELEANPERARTGKERPVTLELTPLGRTNPMLRLSTNEDANAAIWRKFPPISWVNRVSRAKPAAQVLLVDPDPTKTSRFGKMPVMAIQQYGLGQVLYIGTDNLWRLRKAAGGDYHAVLWSQILQRMALVHLLGGSKRTQLTVDKQNYTTGDKVTVYARLYNENFEAVTDPMVAASFAVKPEQGAVTKQDVQMRATPEQPGMYRADFVAVAPGGYQFSVTKDPQTVVEFAVTAPQFELGETAMNEKLLRQIAETSGGAFFREEDLHKLPAAVGKKGSSQVKSTIDAELWSSPFYFALMLAVAASEWMLRKKSQLK